MRGLQGRQNFHVHEKQPLRVFLFLLKRQGAQGQKAEMAEEKDPFSFAERIARLEARKQRKVPFVQLESKEFLEKKEEGAKSNLSSGLGLAFHLASDLIAGLAVGGTIGYIIDYCLSYRAIFLIIFVFLGFAAGLVNMWRSLSRAGFSPLD
ncbi:hypothetical protein FAI41_08070 [Acetobacteraceae bacterium]|nr:hypothetical protein FAI41_08070 [Acetobacteraceae bacterium]